MVEVLRRDHEESLRTNHYWISSFTSCCMSSRLEQLGARHGRPLFETSFR